MSIVLKTLGISLTSILSCGLFGPATDGSILFKSKLKAYGKNLSTSSKKIFAYVSELFRGYKEIKILDKHNVFKQRNTRTDTHTHTRTLAH